jgi:hypothetical protein
LTGLLGLLAAAIVSAQPAQAVAAGCTPDRPTFVGGTLTGYPDGRALDAHIGVSVGYRDSAGRFHATTDAGAPIATGQLYSWIDMLNPATGADGTTDPAAVRTWGRCVVAKITTQYTEMYPKAPTAGDPATQRTDKSRYGSTADYAGTVRLGERGNVALRAPVTFQAGAGNTGGVQGYITYAGKPVPASAVTRVRAFPGPGSQCGVEGYSAAADKLVSATGPARTYYLLDYLAGGQCGAATQAYSFQVSATVGGITRNYSRTIRVARGTWPRVDVALT